MDKDTFSELYGAKSYGPKVAAQREAHMRLQSEREEAKRAERERRGRMVSTVCTAISIVLILAYIVDNKMMSRTTDHLSTPKEQAHAQPQRAYKRGEVAPSNVIPGSIR